MKGKKMGAEKLKVHSDNIRVVSGRILIQNLNWFPDPRLAEFTRDNLLEIIGRSTLLLTEFVKRKGGWGRLSAREIPLPILSAPYFEGREDEIVLQHNYLWWNGKLFGPGFVFRFAEDGTFSADGSEDAVVIPCETRYLHVDVYGSKESDAYRLAAGELFPGEVFDDSRNAGEEYEGLDDADPEDYDPEDFDEDFFGAKAAAIRFDADPSYGGRIFLATYGDPTHSGGGPGITQPEEPSNFFLDDSSEENERGFAVPEIFWSLTDEKNYDLFLVEVTDPSQPFAYISVEKYDPDAENEGVDAFRDTFDYTMVDHLAPRRRANDAAGIVPTMEERMRESKEYEEVLLGLIVGNKMVLENSPREEFVRRIRTALLEIRLGRMEGF